MPTAMLATLAGLLGLALGSFASVPIHRWPRRQTVTEPRRSRCPACDAPIGARDNVPVLSWLLLRGRCRACGARIGWRYPAVELATAVLFAAAAAIVGWRWLLLAVLVLAWALVVATAIDLEHRIIPNRLTYPLPLVLAVPLALDAAATGQWGALGSAALWALIIPGGLLLFAEAFRALRGQAGMGMGDIKLTVSLALVLGYLSGWHLLVFFYATVAAAVAVILVLAVSGRVTLASRIPFGPYLAIGALTAILAGAPLTGAAQQWLGL